MPARFSPSDRARILAHYRVAYERAYRAVCRASISERNPVLDLLAELSLGRVQLVLEWIDEALAGSGEQRRSLDHVYDLCADRSRGVA